MEPALLTELNLYPIKSCAGIALTEARVTASGLISDVSEIGDREWMVVDPSGRFITQREFPVMARILPTLDRNIMTLHAPGMPSFAVPVALPEPQDSPEVTVQVWDDRVTAYDYGNDAAQWFSDAIGTSCRLVRFHPKAVRQGDPEWTEGADAPTLFADGFPLLMIYEASLQELNRRLRALGRDELPMNRFRPNIVLSGGEAFEEDFAQSVEIGDAILKPVKPCPRCPIPSIDQTTGAIGPDPRDALRSERSDPRLRGMVTFGVNCVLLQGDGSLLRTGQPAGIFLDF